MRPDLNDEFAKDVSETQTVEEFAEENSRKSRSGDDEASSKRNRLGKKLLAKLVGAHDFPVPQALVEHQMDSRLERTVRSLAAQGVDPRAVNVDWVSLAEPPEGPRGRGCEGRIVAGPNRHRGKHRRDRGRCGKTSGSDGATQWRIRYSRSRELDKAGSAR